ncbi:unnamed protein product [Thelazia callipaeda]|uniref:HTH_33 domain-containing protein n=1 Tax=Thelazia callipaeda TaxID=103827 RepID=A0A0N5CTS3_THECL|nr:unnamed protein product [Thelazia callipaeda]
MLEIDVRSSAALLEKRQGKEKGEKNVECGIRRKLSNRTSRIRCALQQHGWKCLRKRKSFTKEEFKEEKVLFKKHEKPKNQEVVELTFPTFSTCNEEPGSP